MGVRVHKIPKGSGVYGVVINHKKRRKTQLVGEKDDAEYVAQGIRVQLASGNFKFDEEQTKEEQADSMTLREYFTEIDLPHLKAALSEGTKQGYEDNFRIHVGPALGDHPLNAIDRKMVKGFVAALVEKGLSRGSIRKIIAELCAMLQRAIEDGYIISNVASRMSGFYKHARVREEPILPFSKEEVSVFLQSVKAHYPYYLPVFITFLHSGMRCGELAALCWRDVDFEKRWLHVRSSITRGGSVGKTKSGRTRKIDMSDLLIATLKQWQQDQQKCYGDDLPEWVFTNHEGGRLDMKNLYHRSFIGSLKKAKWKKVNDDGTEKDMVGLKHRRLHDLRHTFATLLVMNGESLA
ncbi:site-specific integrase, partial [bacterium]|nr:site-specific integrase [bacterium]